jgi:DNA-binding transcriptional ArsR family regulator/cyclopropane fatty-acyl-phospholipid synthase-like methyltransferase
MTSAVTKIHANYTPSTEGALLSFCKASGDQLRLNILKVLSRDSFGVFELCQIFNIKQSAMSHHLKILAKSGLVSTRRDGNSIFYRRSLRAATDTLVELQNMLFNTIDQQVISSEINKHMLLVQQDRAANSKLFFSENADKFSQQQEQIAAYEIYGPHTIDLIVENISPEKATIALEIGPGEGLFLTELSPRFKKVIALDNSAPMLNKASQLASTKKIENITFIHGDTKSTELDSLDADCVVVNMVLHHTPAPAEIFFDLANVTTTGGQLYVTDLCSHDQDWAKESCGDVWLGFAPEDLTQWAIAAGFKPAEEVYLTQRNGFRVQIRQFIKI